MGMIFDTFIKNGHIIDGSGRDGYEGNIGIKDGKIKICYEEHEAKQVIDAKGYIVCPGFIDAHSHGDQVLGQYPAMLSKISQGITTELAGQCGGSMFPVTKENLDLAKGLLAIGTLSFPDDMENWTSAKNYFDYARSIPVIGNMRILIGHSTLRAAVMGYDARKPDDSELELMKKHVREAMEAGAIGLSSGLIYSPGCYGDIDELATLAAEVKPYGGYYASHIRSESAGLIDAVKEAIEIGRRAGVPVWISHHKAAGRQYWGDVQETLRLIDEANQSGIQVTLDQYPYDANMTNLNICIPPKYFENGGVEAMVSALKDPDMRKQIRGDMIKADCGYDNFYQNAGGFEHIFISGCPNVKEADGMFVSEYAEKVGKDPFDAYFDLLIANGGYANATYFTISEEDMKAIITNENACVGTDGCCRSLEEKTHPRTFATFPKALRFYHKDCGILSLPEMIHKMTGFTAKRAGLTHKGLIQDGYDGDLVIFNYDTIRDAATYVEPVQLCDGIEYVLVDGQVVYHDKKITGIYPGKIF